MSEQWITPAIETLEVNLTENTVGSGMNEDVYIQGLKEAITDNNPSTSISLVEGIILALFGEANSQDSNLTEPYFPITLP